MPGVAVVQVVSGREVMAELPLLSRLVAVLVAVLAQFRLVAEPPVG